MNGTATLGYIHQIGGWHLSPELRNFYSYFRQEGFTEQGASGLNLTVQPRNLHVLQVQPGLRFGPDFSFQSLELSPSGFAGVRHTNMIAGSDLTQGLPVGGTFTLTDVNQNRTHFVLGAGLDMIYQDRLSMGLDYYTYMGNGLTSHYLEGSLRAMW